MAKMEYCITITAAGVPAIRRWRIAGYMATERASAVFRASTGKGYMRNCCSKQKARMVQMRAFCLALYSKRRRRWRMLLWLLLHQSIFNFVILIIIIPNSNVNAFC